MTPGNLPESLAKSPHAAVIANARGMVVHWNPAAEKLFGWAAGEIEGRPAFFLAPEDRAFFLACLQDKHSGGLDRLRCCHKDGSRMEMAVALMPVQGQFEEDAHCLGLFLDDRAGHSTLTPAERISRLGVNLPQETFPVDDIAERLQFESLVSNISAGLIQAASGEVGSLLGAALGAIRKFFAADQVILSYAPRAARREVEVLIDQGGRMRELKSDPDHSLRLEELLRYLTHQKSFRFTRPDEIPATWRAERELADEHGIGAGLWVRLGVAQEHLGVIALNHRQPGPHWGPETDHRLQLLGEILSGALHRRNAERELANAKAFYDSVVTGIPAAIFVKDAEDLRFVFLNTAAEGMLGQPAAQVLGRTNEEIFAPEEAAALTRQDRQALESGELVETDRQPLMSRTLGQRFLRSMKIPIPDDRGVPRFLLGITEDITDNLAEQQENARLKARLIEARRMDSLSALAGGIAHDFNNILYAIIGYTHMAREIAADDPEMVKVLDHVLKGGQRATKLVQQIQVLSKPAAGKREGVGLKALLEEGLDLLGKNLGRRIALSADLERPAPMVRADSAGLFQALMGVLTELGSAHSANEEPSRIHLHLGTADGAEGGPCLVGALSAGPYARVILAAPDLAWSAEDSRRCLEPGLDPGEGGPGVNLAHLASVVSDHGGALRLGTAPGAGLRLEILLPADDSPGSGTPAEADSPSRRDNLPVLFVDEAESVSQLVTESLDLQGYSVTHCTSAAASRKAFLENPDGWAAVVIDDPLPLMSWVELVGQLRELNPTVPIVFLHEEGEGPSREQMQEVGAARSISKPIDIQHLTRSLQELTAAG